jgi:hypothetical protein
MIKKNYLLMSKCLYRDKFSETYQIEEISDIKSKKVISIIGNVNIVYKKDMNEEERNEHKAKMIEKITVFKEKFQLQIDEDFEEIIRKNFIEAQ